MRNNPYGCEKCLAAYLPTKWFNRILCTNFSRRKINNQTYTQIIENQLKRQLFSSVCIDSSSAALEGMHWFAVFRFRHSTHFCVSERNSNNNKNDNDYDFCCNYNWHNDHNYDQWNAGVYNNSWRSVSSSTKMSYHHNHRYPFPPLSYEKCGENTIHRFCFGNYNGQCDFTHFGFRSFSNSCITKQRHCAKHYNCV